MEIYMLDRIWIECMNEFIGGSLAEATLGTHKYFATIDGLAPIINQRSIRTFTMHLQISLIELS